MVTGAHGFLGRQGHQVGRDAIPPYNHIFVLCILLCFLRLLCVFCGFLPA